VLLKLLRERETQAKCPCYSCRARAALDGGTATPEPDDSPFEQPAVEASEAGFYRQGWRIRFGRDATPEPSDGE